MVAHFEGIKLGNIPIYNLLEDFFLWDECIRTEEFRSKLSPQNRDPIGTHLLTWNAQSDDLVTLILQRAVLGLECYVPAAVYIELGMCGRLTNQTSQTIRNPFKSYPGKSAVHCYYNALPCLLSPENALEVDDPELWEELRGFYKKVRNKIFHGYWVSASPNALEMSFDMFRRTYGWVAKWHALELSGAGQMHLQIGKAKFRMRSYRKTSD